MAGSDFWADFGKRLGIGIAVGLGIMMGITAVFLPASYMMNKLIYHHPFMRFITGLIAGILSIISFLVLVVMRIFFSSSVPQIHYFGLFPVVDIPGQGSYTGWPAIVFTIFSYIFHPFITFYSGSDEDKEGYKEAVSGLLVKGELTEEFDGQKFAKGAVCEAFFEKAREAGSIPDPAAWEGSMDTLSDTGKKLFYTDVSSTPVRKPFKSLEARIEQSIRKQQEEKINKMADKLLINALEKKIKDYEDPDYIQRAKIENERIIREHVAPQDLPNQQPRLFPATQEDVKIALEKAKRNLQKVRSAAVPSASSSSAVSTASTSSAAPSAVSTASTSSAAPAASTSSAASVLGEITRFPVTGGHGNDYQQNKI